MQINDRPEPSLHFEAVSNHIDKTTQDIRSHHTTFFSQDLEALKGSLSYLYTHDIPENVKKTFDDAMKMAVGDLKSNPSKSLDILKKVKDGIDSLDHPL
jgi:hypothetical protein